MTLPIIWLAAAHVSYTAPLVTITHYSDAQCPCSARVPYDIRERFLTNTSGFEGLVDFTQNFVGDLVKDPNKCIHGEEECVAQRHFACAQNISDPTSAAHPPPFSATPAWLAFEVCSYGHCTDCAAIEGPHCPCSNYTTFPEYTKNDIMRRCADSSGLSWDALHSCSTGPLGQQLMADSARRSNAAHVTYGVDGLAPIYVDGVRVKTRKPIPVVCGPVPDEVETAVCTALRAKGKTPPACATSM